MDDIKKSLLQLWKELSISRRLSLLTSFVLIAAVMATLIYLSSRPKLTLLYGGLSSPEAAKVVEYLNGRKISYELGDNGSSVLVPDSQVYEIRLALAAQGIPRTSDVAGGVGFELFDRPSFGMSDFMQKANYYRGLQGELARTVKQMEEVQDARVMIVVPEDHLFSREKRESKASVFVQVRAGRSLSDSQVQAIRFLIASGVEGLQPNRVSIIDSAGRALASDEDGSGGAASGLTGGQQSMVKTVEDRLRDKAQSMLDEVLGPGQAVVRVTADLDFDNLQETAEKFDPKGTVVRTETVNSETNNSKTESISGASGISSNSQSSTSKSESPTTSSQQQHENTVNQYEISRSVETRQKAPGEIRRLTAAVFINSRKAAAGGKSGAQARTPQEIKALEDIVKAAIGFTQNDTRKDTISLQEVEFTDLFAGQAATPQSTSMVQQLNHWLPYATQGLLVCLAGAVLFYLRGMMRDMMTVSGGGDSDFTQLLAQIEQTDLNGATAVRKNGSSTNGALTVDEMSKIIREHPSNTVQAIKQWINRN